MDNIYYFKSINKLGGTEQFLYEIAKCYKEYDITIYYDNADKLQLKRLKKYVRCIKRIPGEKVICERAFFNFNIDMIDDVESTENYYCFVSHAIFQELGYKPPINHPKLNHFIGVSKYSADKLKEFANKIGLDIKADVCYNPLKIEKPDKVIKLICASRLADKTKGGDRVKALIKEMDDYCLKNDRHYLMLVFADRLDIDSENVILMKPRLDVRHYIANADYTVQLSNNMETYCYTLNESLLYGVPIITTPLTILDELGVPSESKIVIEYNLSNIKEAVKDIFENDHTKFKYKIPKDNWLDFIYKSKTTYKGEIMIKVKATNEFKKNSVYPEELTFIPDEGYEFEVTSERYKVLTKDNSYGAVFVEKIRKQKLDNDKPDDSLLLDK